MLRNGVAGFALVFLVLALFLELLELSLAFRVSLGIPFSSGPSRWMPGFDVSINGLTPFGFVPVWASWSTTPSSWARLSPAASARLTL